MSAVERLAISRARLRAAITSEIRPTSLYQQIKKLLISKISSAVVNYPVTTVALFFVGGMTLMKSRPWSWKINLKAYKPWLVKIFGIASGISTQVVLLFINEAMKNRRHGKLV